MKTQIITLEIETDIPLDDLKESFDAGLSGLQEEFWDGRLNIKQVSGFTVDQTKEKEDGSK